MAGTAQECNARSPHHYAEANRTGRKRTTIQSAGAQRKVARCRKTEMRRSTQLNRLNAASLARWVVMTALLAVAGLSYVYLTLQLHWLGDRQKTLETTLAGLRKQKDVANLQIAALTSSSALQRRLKGGFIKMGTITENKIVRLGPALTAPQDNDIHPGA